MTTLLVLALALAGPGAAPLPKPGEGGPWPPLVSRPPREAVSLRGRVVVHGPAADQRVSYVKLELLREGHTMISVATDRDGQFQIKQDLPRGRYQLVVDPADYEGQLEVVVADRVPDVVVFAKRRGR